MRYKRDKRVEFFVVWNIWKSKGGTHKNKIFPIDIETSKTERKQKGNCSLFQWFSRNSASVDLVICDFWMVYTAKRKRNNNSKQQFETTRRTFRTKINIENTRDKILWLSMCFLHRPCVLSLKWIIISIK